MFTTHEPCAMCVGALLEAQVRTLVYAVPDERQGAAGGAVQLARAPGMPHQISVISGVREDEARRLVASAPVAGLIRPAARLRRRRGVRVV